MINIQAENTDFNISYIKKMTIYALGLYFILMVFYYFSGYKEDVPFYMEACRFVLYIYAVFMLMSAFLTVSTKSLLLVNAFLYLLIVIFIKYTYSHEMLDYFANAVDSYSYLNYATMYGDTNAVVFIGKLTDIGYFRDDLGYFFFLWTINKIYPDINFVIYCAIFLNVIALYISSVFLYKLQMLLTGSDFLSRFTSLFYSCSAFLVITTANGLKEVIFLTFIIISVYYIYKLKNKFSFRSLLIFFFSSFFCLFFRTAVFYMLMVTLIVAFTANMISKKMFLVIILVGFGLVYVLLPYVIDNFMDTTIEDVTRVAEHRINIRGYNKSIVSQITPIISAIFGPYPNFDRTGAYAFVHSLTPFMKCFFGFAFLSGLYTVIKETKSEYYPLLTYVFMSVYMTVLAGVSLDIRYHFTYFPFFLILSFNFFRKHKWFDLAYICIAIIMMYMYSTRNMFDSH